ncbi:hypothetical protein ACHAXT_005465 [Thalassiosira profunda]
MSYKAGIVSAITELEGLSGSSSSPSSTAIKTHMQAKWLAKDKRWMNGTYLSTLKKMVADKELVQDRDSFKLARYKKTVSIPSKPPSPSTWSKSNATLDTSNAELLANELAKYDLKRRSDSKLCDAFVNGTTDKTAEEVALVMCRMQYLYGGYCAEFNKEMRGIEEAIEAETEFIAKQYADPCSSFEGYYSGITRDACHEVTGEYSFGGYKRGVVESWKEFPAEWPWMKAPGALASNDDKNRKKKKKKMKKKMNKMMKKTPAPQNRNAAKGGSGKKEETAGEVEAKLPIFDLPEAIVQNVAIFLPKTSAGFLAVAMTASPTTWGDSDWQLEPTAASKAIVSAYANEHGKDVWDIIDFEDIRGTLRKSFRVGDNRFVQEKDLAPELDDNDIGALLACIGATHIVRRIKLTGCTKVLGHGLEPLRGSMVLEQFDFSLVAQHGDPNWVHGVLSEEAVAPILSSIVQKEGNSLKHIQLAADWVLNETEIKNAALKQCLEDFNDSLNSRPFGCSGCGSDRDGCLGTGGDDDWFAYWPKDEPKDHSAVSGYSGVPPAHCCICGTDEDNFNNNSDYCTGCSKFDACTTCNDIVCYECSACDCDWPSCSNCVLGCAHCDEVYCTHCQTYTKETEGNDLFSFCDRCQEPFCLDCVPKVFEDESKLCLKCRA